MVDRYTTIVYYITRARHKRAHKHNKCDSGVVGNARPCQGRDRGFEPRLSLFIKRYPSWISLFHYKSVAEPLTRGAEQFINTTGLSVIKTKGRKAMKLIYATYNQYCNSIDITTFDNMLLRIDCSKAEDGLKITPNSQCALNALAIDEPMEYARLVLDGEMQAWIDAEDSLEVW